MPSGVRRPRMRDVEILPSDDGRPHVRVAPSTTLTGRTVDVSIAHDGHFAVAVAVIPDAITPSSLVGDGRGGQSELPDGFRLPTRPRDGHKGTFGTVVVLAGSQGFTGAAYLASMGAARSGAGIVRLLVAQSIYPILAEKCTEVIVGPVPEISPGVVGRASLSGVLRGLGGAGAGVGRHRRCAGGIDRRLAGPEAAALRGRGDRRPPARRRRAGSRSLARPRRRARL